MHILYIYLIIGVTFTLTHFVLDEPMTIGDFIVWTLAGPIFLAWGTIQRIRGK